MMRNRKHRRCSARRQRGAGLIEVLVSVVVLSIGLLGMAQLQARSTQAAYSAYYRSQASWLAYDIADRMRVNRGAAIAGAYDLPLSDPAPVCEQPLTGLTGNLADDDLAEWLNQLACLMPAGNGSIVRNGRLYMISIQWNDSRGGTPADDDQTFVYQTEL